MNIDRISRSKSYEMITSFGLKIWDKLGAEGTLSENEDPKEGYRALGQLIEETHRENVSEMEQYRGMIVREVNDIPSAEMQQGINLEFEAIKLVLEDIEFKEDAEKCVNDKYPDWKMAVDIKKLINQKPNKK